MLLLGGLFHQVPVMSFPANLLMIPWVVGVVFPVSAAGVLTSLFWPELSGALFALADQAFEVFWRVARWAADYGTFWLPVSAGWAVAVLPLVLICLVRLRLWVLLVLVLTGWLASQRYHRLPVSLTLLDVGQGSAAVVQVGERFWLIDSGTERAGRQVVGPWLQWHGVQNLTVIASHADSDHVGGMAPVLARWPESPRWAAQPPDSSWQRCRAGTVFYHQGPVVLEALWPDDRLPQAAPDNAHSCVVRLKVADWQILMPGDLTRRWQYALTARLPRSDHTLWVVPHHGAANGLNPRFWRAVNPEIAFVSADRNSPYGHPAPVVVDWLAKAGIPVLNTATSGQIGILWPAPDQPPRVRTMDKSGH
ncbi:MAG: hypothetical protein D6758_07905 [Gammaproteobacteria bacterium]|nr:MAG: hypothetical protein D6758_07905 [Gammaproteobacteria bacterium]